MLFCDTEITFGKSQLAPKIPDEGIREENKPLLHRTFQVKP